MKEYAEKWPQHIFFFILKGPQEIFILIIVLEIVALISIYNKIV